MAASSKDREELILEMDWDYIDACNGITFDTGGSVMKLVYVSKDDWVHPKDRKPCSKGSIRLINFAREELSEAYNFVNSEVKMNRSSPDETVQVYSCGIGATEFAQDFQKNVNAKNMNLSETDCFQKAFNYLLEKIPRKDLIHPIHKPAFEIARKEVEQNLAMLDKMKGKTALIEGIVAPVTKVSIPQEDKVVAEGELMTAEPDLYPCGMVMCGSAFGILKIQENGTMQYLDMSNRGGRMFLGLGALLTGAERFEELIELAEKGQANKVSVTSKNISESVAKSSSKEGDKKAGEEEEDLYKLWLDENNVEEVTFCFGQAVGKKLDDFKKEDLAKCLLETLVLDLVSFAHTNASKHQLRHVFFCGGFAIHPLIRKLIMTEWVRKDVTHGIFDQSSTGYIQPHFLVHGQSLGALGAFLNHKDQWSVKMAKQAKEDMQAAKED